MGYGLTQEGTCLGYVPSSEHSEHSCEQGGEGQGCTEESMLALLSVPLV